MASETLEGKLHQLEQVLVKQFRTLQKLLDVTKKERASLLADSADSILSNVEEKESVLDQLSLIEDSRRMLVQDLEVMLDIHSETLSINDLLPKLSAAQATPLKRLSEGIHSLVIQVRDLTYGNQALACYKTDWLRSLQTFLVSAAMPEPSYRPPMTGRPPEEPAAHGFEFHA